MLASAELAHRLEHAEGASCAGFADAHRTYKPDCGSEWRRIYGAWAVFDGVGAPTTQSFGLGLSGELLPSHLEETEQFFFQRGASADHEICPHAGVAVTALLCSRGYLPIETSNVLYQPTPRDLPPPDPAINVRVIQGSEADMWSDLSAQGWADEAPDLVDFIRELGRIAAGRTGGVSFVAEIDGVPAATGGLFLHEGVALLAGAATIPAFRRRGLQGALLRERLRHAKQIGCDVAMMVAAVGSTSQLNAERAGFRVAYSRTKWRSDRPSEPSR